MIYVIVENDVITNRTECDNPDFASSQGWVPDDNYGIGWVRDGETFVAPPESAAVVSDEVTALQGMLALDAAGKASDYEGWAGSPDRTFAERAFIEKAIVWRRTSETITSACAALNISDAERDQLFILAATL